MSLIFNRISNNTAYSLLFLFAVSIIFFIGLGHIHLFDWDEINFAESAREMIASNNYLRVQINYNPFWEKPPFFFWLQVVSMKIFGINEFAARFPNAVFGYIYLITFYLICTKHFNRKLGLIWGFVFVGSFLPHLYFKSGIIDPVFNYFIFMSIYFFARLFTGEGNLKKHALVAGIFSGLSVVTKGPVGLLLFGLTLLTYIGIKRFKILPSFRDILFFIFGISIIIGIWLGIEFNQNGFTMLEKFIAYHLDLFNTSVAGHEQPFFYHFVVILLGCFPISVFALPYLFKKSASIELDFKSWMLSLFWVVLILFSIATTKILHYSSMTYIPLSFLAAFFINQIILKQDSWRKYQTILFIFLGSIWGIVFIFLPIIMIYKEILFPFINDPFAISSMQLSIDWSGRESLIGVLFLIGISSSVFFIKRSRILLATVITSSTVSITLLMLLFFVLPKVEKITQGPAIEFYKSIEGEECYVDTYGYKSYAQYFYFKKPFSDFYKNMKWFLSGEIDKPVYLVSKSTNIELDSHPNFTLIQKKGGFKFYLREVR